MKAKTKKLIKNVLIAVGVIAVAWFAFVRKMFAAPVEPVKRGVDIVPGTQVLSAADQVRKDYPNAEATLRELDAYNKSRMIPTFGGGVLMSHLNWAKGKDLKVHPVRIGYSRAITYDYHTAMKHAKIFGII